MKLSLHIGMGKTGTSAIQASLSRSGPRLIEHGVCYLGMWWGFLDPDLDGPAGMERGAKLGRDELRGLAERLLAHMRAVAARTPVTHFVFSNEALYSHTDAYEPLYDYLAEHVELQLVVFVREPRDWLASAYAQWGIRHKVDAGPLPSFAEWATAKIGIYGGLRYWHRRFGPRLVVRMFDPALDVVADFMAAIGCAFEVPSATVYKTPEPALLVLQAAYNETFHEPVLPAQFASEVYDHETSGAPATLEQVIERHFDQSVVPELASRWREVFDGIRGELGIDLWAGGSEGNPPPTPAMLRQRLLDCLVAIVMQQARRISDLERRLARLEDDTAGPA